jgi:hypothetical protein
MENFELSEEIVYSQELVDYIRDTSRGIYSHDLLTWQYGSAEGRLFTIRESRKVLGTQGMLEYILFDPALKSSIKTMKSETTFVSESLRGTGKFEELYNYAVDKMFEDDYSNIWGFTALIKVWRNKLNFIADENLIKESILFVNERYSFRFSLNYHLKYVRNKSICLITNILIAKKNREFEILYDSRVSHILNEINTYLKNDDEIRLDYNNPFFKKRVDENPILNYKISYIRALNMQISGFIIFNEANNVLYISDIHFANNKVMNALLSDLYHYSKKSKINRIKFFGNYRNSTNGEVFNYFNKKLGLIEKNVNMTWVIKFNANSKLDDYTGWKINGLWTEGFTY